MILYEKVKEEKIMNINSNYGTDFCRNILSDITLLVWCKDLI